jgi:hypothetical protein
MVNADVIRSGDCVFIKYTKTKFRSHEFSVCRLYKTEQWAFPLCLESWPWQREYMNVLIKLGLMKKERRDELVEIDRQRNEACQRKRDAQQLDKIASRYGLKEVAKAAASLQAPKEAA